MGRRRIAAPMQHEALLAKLRNSVAKDPISPIKAKPLRNPGQSLDEQIQKLFDSACARVGDGLQ